MAKANWLTISPMSGTGNATIRNIGSEHTGRLDRTTTVTGKAVGIVSEKIYSVVQHAKSEFVAVNDASYQVAGKGGTVTVSGTSNSPTLTVTVDDGGTVGTLTVKDATVTNGQAIPGDPGAAEQYSWKVQIQVAENPTVNQRSLTVRVQGSSSSIADTIEVVQAASSFTYEYVPSASVSTIAASGGNSVISAQLKTYRNGSLVSTQTVTPTLSGSATGFSISGATVTALNRGTTVGGVRSITVTCKYVTSETGETLSDTVEISQSANSRVIVYGKPTITSFEVADIPASGGSVSSGDVEYSQSRHYYYDSGQTEELSPLTTGGSLSWGNAVTAPSRGTTIGNREIVGTLTVTVSMNGQTSVEQDVSVYQAKNVPVDAVINEHLYAYPTGAIPAAGGTKTPSSASSSVKLTWSSGSTSVVTSSGATGITAEYSDRTYSMVAATGFSINSSTGVVTAVNRGTTAGAERKSGNCSRYIKWTIIVSDTYGGGSFVVEDTKTLTTPVSQQANTADYGNVTLNASNPATVAASGGTATISASASQTVSFTSGQSRAGNVSITYTQKAAVSGFSLNGNKVTVTANSTTSARSYVVTVKATGEGSKTATKDVTVSQAAGSKSYSDITLNVSYPTIAAKGGTVTPTVSYSQTWGWNGSTTGGGTITSGGTLTYSGTSVSTSNGAVTAGTKGTNVSGVTTVTTATVKVTLNGKTAQKQVTVQQAANAITNYGNVTISGGTVSDIPAKGGSVSSMSGISASQTITYTSESTRAGTVKITYSTAISGTSLGTTIKNRTKLGTLTATATGEGSKTATKALDVYQAKNVPTSVSVSAHSYSYPTGAIPAAGGTKTPSASSTLTVKFSSGATKAEQSGDKEGYTLTATRTYSMVAATGFSINTSTGVITATNRATTEGAARSCGNTSRKVVWTCTIDSTYGGGTISDSDTKTLTTPVSQAANTLSYSYANPTVTVAAVTDIPASGGTKSSSTVTYKQVRTNSYSSGSSTTTELTSGGTVSWSTAISGSNLGTTAKARTKLGTLTATVTMNGKSGTGSVDVYQQANAITGTTYSTPTVTISSVADIPAKGGSVSTGTATYSQTKTDTYTSGSSKPTTLTSGGTVKWSTVSAGTKGTTVSARTEVDEITCTVTLNSKSGSATKMVYQAGNYVTAVDLTGFAISYSKSVSAAGGTVSPSVTQGSVKFTFTSGASSSTTPSSTYGSLTSSVTYSGSAANGFSVPNSSSGAMTSTDRAKTEGAARNSGTVTATKKVTWTPTSSYNGGGTKTDSMSDTDYATQVANVRTTGDISYGAWQVSVSANRYTTTSNPCPASGGTCTITATATRTRTQNYSYTSGDTSTEALTNESGTPTLSISGTGASLSDTTVTWESRGTTTGEVRQATVTATIDSIKAEEVVYQQANSYEDTYLSPIINTPNPSHNFSKDGGTWASGVTVSQNGTRTYTSGSTSPITGSASFTLSESVDWLTTSGGSITALANTTSSSRSATVTINATGSGGATSRSTLSITQDAGAYLNVSPTSLSFASTGGTKSITIDTNESWTIS